MMGKRKAGVVVALVVLLGAVPSARADLPPPPEYTACDNLQEGAECAGGDVDYGVCVPDTCSRLDYSQLDGGTPAVVTYDCLRCEARERPIDEDDESCSVGRVGRSAGAGLALCVPLWLLGLALRRASRRAAR